MKTAPRLDISAPGLVYRATAADLPGLEALLREAHSTMQLPHTVEWTLETLPLAMEFPMTYVLVSENFSGPHAYCWAEVLQTEQLMIHQLYVRPRTDWHPGWREVLRVARREKCSSIIGLTFRPGGPRAFRRHGFAPVGVLVRKEL